MLSLITSHSDGIFNIFGLGFIAGGLFAYAVMQVADWISERNTRAKKHSSKINF